MREPAIWDVHLRSLVPAGRTPAGLSGILAAKATTFAGSSRVALHG
jgi:hypothetical protein